MLNISDNMTPDIRRCMYKYVMYNTLYHYLNNLLFLIMVSNRIFKKILINYFFFKMPVRKLRFKLHFLFKLILIFILNRFFSLYFL